MAGGDAVLPSEVSEWDRSLQGEAEKSSQALARLRWQWTLSDDPADRGGADKVSFRSYGRAVGVGESLIRRYANAWAKWLGTADPGARFLVVLNQVRFGEDRMIAAKAVGIVNPIEAGVHAGRPRTARGVIDHSELRKEAKTVEARLAAARDEWDGPEDRFDADAVALEHAEEVKAGRLSAAAEARRRAEEELERFEAALSAAAGNALTEAGFSDQFFQRAEEAAIVKDKVRGARSDYIAAQGSAAGFDIEAKSVEFAGEREQIRKRHRNRMVEPPAPKVGFELLLAQMLTRCSELREWADEMSLDWDLTEKQQEALRKVWAEYSGAYDTLQMAVESKTANIVKGAEALLKGGTP